ncbi:MAG: hypothetical protein ACI4SG_00405 [Oligosphaeraceae bacterium]
MTDPIRDIHLGAPAECLRPCILGPALREGCPRDPRTLPAPEKCPPRPSPLDILFLGKEEEGLAEALARQAVSAGHRATVVIPRQRALPQGVSSLVADREQEDFPRLLHPLLRKEDRTPRFALTVDCAGTCPRHARQDLEEVALPGTHLAFLSQDLVYDPESRDFPTCQERTDYCPEETPVWGPLHQAELHFLQSPPFPDGPHWTILRLTLLLDNTRCLDAFPPFQERWQRLKEGQPVQLLSGGHWLVQPLAVADLARILFALPQAPAARGAILDCAGPRRLEFRQLCQMAARLMGREAVLQEEPRQETLALHPEYVPYLCHRLYPLPWACPGIPAPLLSPQDVLKELL